LNHHTNSNDKIACGSIKKHTNNNKKLKKEQKKLSKLPAQFLAESISLFGSAPKVSSKEFRVASTKNQQQNGKSQNKPVSQQQNSQKAGKFASQTKKYEQVGLTFLILESEKSNCLRCNILIILFKRLKKLLNY
jgi:hypothetical protein